MKIFKLTHESDGYKSIDITNSSIESFIVNGYYNDGKDFNLEETELSWYNNGDDEIICDFPFIAGNIPVISEKAFNVLSDEINKCNVEIIHLNIDKQKYYLLHFKTLSENLINTKESDIKYFRSGKIMSIDKFVFNKNIDDCPPLFINKDFPTILFCTDKVTEIIKNNKLIGLHIQECEVKAKGFLGLF